MTLSTHFAQSESAMGSPSVSWSTETARQRLVDLATRLDDNAPELAHVFNELFIDEALAALPESGQTDSSPLAGALVSIKDLFDVQGYVTRAGSRFMSNDPAATADAIPVKRLRNAGAVLLGHTNMTELAYSGLGLNPHYGTPESALIPGCIPGGSTAGGAVSVATGVADIALGTDTGGSLRIPAAFNGIVGFKPTQSTVSRQGCKALSYSMDSVGPMASSVYACTLAYEAIASAIPSSSKSLHPLLIVPSNFGMDDLDPIVAAAFEKALSRLSKAGYSIVEKSLPVLQALTSLPVWHFASIEARNEYNEAYTQSAELFDPRVHSRMTRADDVDAVTYCHTLNAREKLIAQFRQELGDGVLLLPTVPIMPPPMSLFTDDDTYYRINLQVLRNPTIANAMDGCSISLPYRNDGDTIGVMLTAAGLSDHALLQMAAHCEAVFSSSGE